MYIKKSIYVILSISALISCETKTQSPSPELAVFIVVDQFRADLLEEYGEYLNGGLDRLKNDGFHFTNAFHEHALTNSAPGHATINTGLYPKNHGIVDNFWLKPNGDDWTVELNDWDTTVVRLGEPDARFGISPKVRIAPGILDWLTDTYPQSKVYSIGAGTSATTALAPKNKGESYWSTGSFPGFTTSSYSLDELPTWITEFNELQFPTYMDTLWELNVPEKALAQARRDNADYENGGANYTFPHRASLNLTQDEMSNLSGLYDWFSGTPGHDRAVAGLVKETIRANNLGTNGVLDMINVTFGSLDDVGHAFGPFSVEQLDALLKLDQTIGELLDFLDEEVGKGNYTVAIAGDHGSITAPEYTKELGRSAKRISTSEIEALINEVHSYDFDENLSFQERSELVKAIALKADFVADAYSFEELNSDEPTNDPYLKLFRNSFREDRIPQFPVFLRDRRSLAEFGVMIRIKENMMPDYAASVHGSVYEYDRKVPIIFYGKGVPNGVSNERVATVDIAPTLGSIININIPSNLDGEVLSF